MQPIWGNVAALAVAMIFYVWRAYHQVRVQQQQTLRERVAYMLWVVADPVVACQQSGLHQLSRS